MRTQTIARRTGAKGVVEGKQARFNFINCEAGHGAGEAGGKHNSLWVRILFGFVCHLSNRNAVGKLEGDLHGVRHAVAKVCTHDKTVDDDVDVVFEFFV